MDFKVSHMLIRHQITDSIFHRDTLVRKVQISPKIMHKVQISPKIMHTVQISPKIEHMVLIFHILIIIFSTSALSLLCCTVRGVPNVKNLVWISPQAYPISFGYNNCQNQFQISKCTGSAATKTLFFDKIYKGFPKNLKDNNWKCTRKYFSFMNFENRLYIMMKKRVSGQHFQCT